MRLLSTSQLPFLSQINHQSPRTTFGLFDKYSLKLGNFYAVNNFLERKKKEKATLLGAKRLLLDI